MSEPGEFTNRLVPVGSRCVCGEWAIAVVSQLDQDALVCQYHLTEWYRQKYHISPSPED